MSERARTLTLRALNRALLARQMLLERQDQGVADAVAHLIGIQAQEPQAPYLALWTRIDGFHAPALSELIATREAVRASLMRATIHLVTAADYSPLWALTSTILARAFRGSQFAGRSTASISTRPRRRNTYWRSSRRTPGTGSCSWPPNRGSTATPRFRHLLSASVRSR